MSTRIVTFRCPENLLSMLNKTATHYSRTRNTILLTAVRLFSRQLREQGGALAPALPDELLTPKTMFPKPESRGGRPRIKGKTK
jgi:hypothetical protein